MVSSQPLEQQGSSNISINCDRLIDLGISGFDSRNFHNFKCGFGVERVPPSLMRNIGYLGD
jgi:hypothetical protein